MKDYKKLIVYTKAENFTVKIYSITKIFPKEELFGITAQIRRAAFSIAANIAEGSSRNTDKDFARFLEISFGSANEVECALNICFKINLISEDNFQKLIDDLTEIKKMLNTLIQKIRTPA